MDKVELIPWDPTSEAHYERMHDQRVACGWRDNEVPSWKEEQLKGNKVMYWVILADSLPRREELMAQHLHRYPKEQEPLIDTSTSVFNSPRDPTGRKFVPVGHTALEVVKPNDAKDLNLPLSSVWVKSIYLSWTLHGGGLGRRAMALTERTAASPPLNATVVALDTLGREWQSSEAYMKAMYEDRGLTRPAKFCSNEEWYLKQGYEPMPGPDSVEWVYPETKVVEQVPLVFLRKTVA